MERSTIGKVAAVAAIVAGAAAGLSAAAQASPASDRAAFDRALATHISAIKSRDIKTFESTLTDGDTLLFLLPDGRRSDTRAAFLAAHRQLFAMPGFIFEDTPISEYVGSSVGTATVGVKVTMAGADGTATVNRSVMTLTFQREMGEWRLVQDQHSPVAAVRPE